METGFLRWGSSTFYASVMAGGGTKSFRERPAMLDILVIDDDDGLRQSLLLLLDAEGFAVTGAASGPEALDLAGKHYYDLVLSDVRMPGMSGLEAIKQLKTSIADAYFIVMTGYASEDAPIEALRMGVDDYLRKPFDLGLLLEKIRGVARRRAGRTESQGQAELWRLTEALQARAPGLTTIYERLERASETIGQGLGWAQAKIETLRLASWFWPLTIEPATEGAASAGDLSEIEDPLDELAALLCDLPCRTSEEPAAQILGGLLAQYQGRALPEQLSPEVTSALAAVVDAPKLSRPTGTTNERLVLRTFGTFQISLDGRTIPDEAWESAKARWLLVYLVTRKGQSLPQDRLAELFWPGATSAKKAHRGLVSAVHRARKALGDSELLASYDRSYGFSRSCSYWLDAEKLLDAFAQGVEYLHQGSSDRALTKFSEMLELYVGDFLPTCHEPWAISKRTELKQKMVEGLERGAQIFLPTDPPQAEQWAARAIGLDPTSEPAYALLIRAQVAQNRRADALRTYNRCAETLADALDLRPGTLVEAAHAEATEA